MLGFSRGFPVALLSALVVAATGCGQADPDGGDVAETDGAADPSFGVVNQEFRDEMKNTPSAADGPFYMVNLIKFRERAEYADGRETELTGREADALYAPLDFLQSIGARPVFVADVEAQLIGSDVTWEQVAVVLYPSRAKFFEMTEEPDFQARTVHKDAGVEKSVVLVTQAEALPAQATEPAAEVPYPATEDDPAFEMIHLMNYYDVAQYEEGSDEPARSGKEAVDLYSINAGTVAFRLGVRPRVWLRVEGVFIGDGREWDEFRINHFPSHAAFEKLTSDPTWEDGVHHRKAGLEDTYSMQTLPLLNTF